jgi:parallel beta-helix repeat protein
MGVRTVVGRVALVGLATSGLLSPAPAAQYVVAPNGNDLAPGTAAAPWKTLQHAAEQVVHGDFVTVKPGNYAGFHLETSGEEGSPISFFAEPGVLVNQPNPIRTDHGINLENASWVTVDGFAVTGMPQAGIRSVGFDGDEFASHVTIRNSRSYNNGKWGILTGFVNDLLIENNETSGSAIEHGIYVSNSGDRPIIRNNISWGNNANGIHMNGDIEQEGDGIISGALVSGNIIYDNGENGGSGINMDGVQNSRIENNLLYNNHHSGISLYRINGGGASTGNVVINNTVYQAADGLWALNIQNASTGNSARNNIFVTQSSSRGAIDISSNSLSGFTSDYNAVVSRFTTNGGNSNQTLAQWQASTNQDLHSLVATAAQLFVNPVAGVGADYHLLATAAAINKGTNQLAPLVDLDGLSRPVGALFDIGAYEWRPALLSGDYNGDGVVNTADYIVWRNTFGATVTPYSGADGDGSGMIGGGDYSLWKASFGKTAASGAIAAAVPEPGVSNFLIAATILSLTARRRVAAAITFVI